LPATTPSSTALRMISGRQSAAPAVNKITTSESQSSFWCGLTNGQAFLASSRS
jgi:hypothetical protein